MNILIPDQWLREFLKTNATPRQIQDALSLCSASVERLRKYGDDYVYEIEVTTNRVDMMSIIGIAKEATACLPQFKHQARLINDPLKSTLSLPTAPTVSYLNVKLNSKLCQRFTAILIKNVKVKPSPPHVVKRLELAGMRGLNNVVDISNYLMLELGQPVHTFDYDKILNHKMILRESRPGEKLTTLDGKTHTLPGGDIVIEDGSGRLIDLCGIMGGFNSAVDNNTKNVLLFVQTYDPVHIRKTYMSLAHRTDAAILFEKGLPIENVPPTLQRGIDLFKELSGGSPETKAIDIINEKKSKIIVKFKSPMTRFINDRLGITLTSSQITNILERLDFKVKSQFLVEIPPQRRLDVNIPEDIVEEVARIYGYHNLPTALMSGHLTTKRNDIVFTWEQKLKSAISHWGFTETYTYSLVSKEIKGNSQTLKLKNPLSEEWEYLRTSLAPSHIKIIQENIGRVPELNLFEIANVYLPQENDLPQEVLHIIISTTNSDFYKLKGIVYSLFWEMGIKWELNSRMNIVVQGKTAGIFLVHKIPQAITAEINLSHIIPLASSSKTYIPISKYPSLVEDININLNNGQTYSDLVSEIHKISSLITGVELVDKYGPKLTLRITYHDPKRQLSSSDIEPIRQKLQSLNT
jgi:phenylalanyl-tRNA synthetase beta chain